MKKLINTVSNFINNLVLKVKNFYYLNVKKPKQDKLDNELKEKQKKQYINDFEKRFNVKLDNVNKLMNDINFNIEIETSRKELDIIKNKNKINAINKKSPFFFEPEIIEIHNENLDLNKPPFNQLINENNDEARILLDKQSDYLSKKAKLKIKK